MSELFSELLISSSAQARADADYGYLPDNVRKAVAQILTTMEAVEEQFCRPKENTFEATQTALAQIEAQARRPLSQREIAEMYEDFRRAMDPLTKLLVDVTSFYPRPIIVRVDRA
jgi:hypothetical protein